MITDSFDDKSPAKINIKKNENAVQVDAVIYTFSEEIEKYVIAHYDCEKVGDIKTPTLIQFNYSTVAYLQAG